MVCFNIYIVVNIVIQTFAQIYQMIQLPDWMKISNLHSAQGADIKFMTFMDNKLYTKLFPTPIYCVC